MVSLPPEHNFRGRLIPMNHTRFPFPQGPLLFSPDGQRLRPNCAGPFVSNNMPMIHRQHIPGKSFGGFALFGLFSNPRFSEIFIIFVDPYV